MCVFVYILPTRLASTETRPLEQEGDAPDVTVMLPTLDGHGRQPLAMKTRSSFREFSYYTLYNVWVTFI